MLTHDEMRAFAAFLLCERDRHMEDVRAIEKRLGQLGELGIVAKRPAGWVLDEELGL
jgi:hypothetical protein